MTESNPVQVTLSDDGLKIANIESTAKSANEDVKKLYDPNLMSPIEKQGTTARFAGETSRYKVIVDSAKSAGIDTKALESAYNTLNTLMASVMGDPDKATDIDREKYAKALEDFNNQMAIMQNALNVDFDNRMQSVSDATSQTAVSLTSADAQLSEGASNSAKALSNANEAVSKAEDAVNNTNIVSADVIKLKGGSTATLAQLENGIQSKVSSSDYESKVTQLSNQIQSVVINNKNMVPYSGYFTSTKGWNMVTWGESGARLTLFKHAFYHNAQDNTLCLTCYTSEGKSISSLRIPVERSTTYTVQFKGFASSNTKQTTLYFLGRQYGYSKDYDSTAVHALQANIKMSPSHIDTYTATFTTTATEDEGYLRFDNGGTTDGNENSIFITEIKMEKGEKATPYEHDGASSEITQLDDNINLRVEKDDVVNQINVSTEGVLIAGKKISITGETHIDNASIDVGAIKNLTADHIGAGTINAKIKITAPDIEGGNFYGSKISGAEFSSPNGTFTVDQNGNVTATSLSLIGNKNNVYNSELLADGAGWSKNAGYVDWATAHSGTYGMSFNGTSGPNDWISFGQSKLMKLTQSNDRAYSLSVWLIDWTSTKGMLYMATLAFFDANKNRITNGSVGAQYTNPDGSIHTWQLLTVENATPPDGTQYVAIQYWAHNGTGHAGFSQPMISQSSRYQGYTADTGNILSSGQVILDNNGTLTTTYDGINQDDEYYHSWNFARGTLSIGKGFITSNAHGVRTINGSNTEADVKGTLAAGYTKFTSSTGGRTYMDADLISLSTKSMTDMVVINSNGVHVNDQGITYVGGLNGSSSWGQFGGIRIGNGANTHTINSPSSGWIYFEQGIGDGNTLETIVAANLSSSSQLSKKKTVVGVKPSGSVVANTNLATYLYKGETNVHGLHMGPIIDDVNTQRKYYISPKIMALDGETIDINKATFYGWSAIQALQRANERLQIRLRKLEIEGKAING